MEILQTILTALKMAVEPLEEGKIFFLFQSLPEPFCEPGFILPCVVTLALTAMIIWLSRNLTDDCESKRQALLEMMYEGLENIVKLSAGEKHAKKLMPVLSTIFIYIFVSNMIGVIPGLKSTTSFLLNCLGMALITFILTLYYGFSTHGFFGYIKHFTGNIWWMAPIMFPIHVIGEISHPISLTLRLFCNIWGEDMVIIVLTSMLCPLLLPLPMLFMSLFTSVLQALVFTILSGNYLSSALDSGH